MTTDTTERGLARLICTAMTGIPCDPAGPGTVTDGVVRERPAAYGAGWIPGVPEDYDREYCVDLIQLSAFLRVTQPDAAGALDLGQDGPTRRKFLARLQGEISRRGTVDVLRHGLKHGLSHRQPEPALGDLRRLAFLHASRHDADGLLCRHRSGRSASKTDIVGPRRAAAAAAAGHSRTLYSSCHR